MPQAPPTTQYQFGPINLFGNPVDRPDGSASFVRDLRVMPGNWLRLRGGRIARRNLTNAFDVHQIQPTAFAGMLGHSFHLCQVKYGSSDCKIVKLNISGGTVTFDEAGLEQIVQSFYYSTLASQPTPIVNLPDSMIWGNGWGLVRASDGIGGDTGSFTEAIPFLTQLDSAGNVRYYGLALRPDNYDRYAGTGDPLAPDERPTLQFASGSETSTTNHNSVATAVKIHIGLYNSATGHYSNTYEVGTQETTGGTGTITVHNARAINWASHGSGELAELFYVFYATLDSYQTPYLILNSTLDGPYTVAVGTKDVPLSIAGDTDNGWVLDLTKPIPTRNYPPRQTSSTWYTNQRLYGILYEFYEQQGYNSPPTASPFRMTDKDQASVCWSEAEGSSRTQQFLGDPLQSWPPNNISPLPSGERPICGTAAPNNIDSIVWSATHTFLLTEQADGIHEWTAVSDTHGLYNPSPGIGLKMWRKTRHGIMWVTQRKQLALYRSGEAIEILSQEYDPLLNTQTPTAVAYWYDPKNFVDRFQVYWSNGSICHDFHTGGYLTTEPHAVRAGAMLTNSAGDTYLIAAAGTVGSGMGVFSIEGQPDQSQAIPRVDQVFAGASGQTVTTSELPEGIWTGNWEDFQDILNRKEIQFIHALGDGGLSATLGGYPLRLELFQDFSSVVSPGSGTLINPAKEKQSNTDNLYIYRISTPHKRWWKFSMRLRSHYADGGGSYFADPASEGDLATNFYGSLMALLFTSGPAPNYR